MILFVSFAVLRNERFWGCLNSHETIPLLYTQHTLYTALQLVIIVLLMLSCTIVSIINVIIIIIIVTHRPRAGRPRAAASAAAGGATLWRTTVEHDMI